MVHTYDSSTGEVLFNPPVSTGNADELAAKIRTAHFQKDQSSNSYGGPWRRERRRIRSLVAEVNAAETKKTRLSALRTLYEYYATIPEFLSRFKAALAFAVQHLNVWQAIGMSYGEYRRFASLLEGIKEHVD